MKNLILSFNVVAPLCFIMTLGYFLKYIKMLDDNSVKVMNNATFKVFLPTLLFYNIYTTDLGSVFNPKIKPISGIPILYVVIYYGF